MGAEAMVIDSLHNLIDEVDSEPARFPRTLQYNEGWMLRLILNWYSRHILPGHALEFQPNATWYSEALLPSPLRARRRGDRQAEARTHADGIIGHFAIAIGREAGPKLLPDATQFIVAEGKMFSPLSGGTRNAPTYDQAARSIACIAGSGVSSAGANPPRSRRWRWPVNSPGSSGRSPSKSPLRPAYPQEGKVRKARWAFGSEAAARKTLVKTMWHADASLPRPTRLDRGSSRRITIMRALPTCRWVLREYQCDSPSTIASLSGSQRSNAPPKEGSPPQERLDRLVHISIRTDWRVAGPVQSNSQVRGCGR